MAKSFLLVFAVTYCVLQVLLEGSSVAACQGLSADVPCQCDDNGRCIKGTVVVDPWLQFALKTQRDIQMDFRFDQMQIFDSHNAFNNRAYGFGYGGRDTCQWPPPYDDRCMGLANHEFSIIDQLNMGIRAFAIDIWWCSDAMRVAHLNMEDALLCGQYNVLFSDVIADIGAWMDEPENEDEFVVVILDEKYDQGHDAEVNGQFERYLGHDRILSPADLRDTYGGVWPTLRHMRQDGKRAVVLGSADHLHQGKYIHVQYFNASAVKKFTNYPVCGGNTDANCLRFRGDATHYISTAIYDGPSSTGVITDLTEMVKCAINFPATDMVNPQLMETAVYTWAKGEPSLELNEHICVILNQLDYRWYTSAACDQSLSYACQSWTDPNDWTVSEHTGPYDVTNDLCPIGYKFSAPQNGFRQQKLKEAMNGKSVWLNYTPWITGVFPTTHAPLPATARAAENPKLSSFLSVTMIVLVQYLLIVL